jgi:hypothetical protein
MSKKPPVPEEQLSPFPVEEPPHAHEADGGEAMKVAKELAAAKQRWSPSAKQIGMGAAIGVGSAAVVAALLYWRGGRK